MPDVTPARAGRRFLKKTGPCIVLFYQSPDERFSLNPAPYMLYLAHLNIIFMNICHPPLENTETT